MRRGGGKAKGSAFERKVASMLSLWLTNGEDDKQLIRSVLSGGWSAGQTETAEGWRHVGDLAPNGPIGEKFRRQYAVECKHGKSINLLHLWTKTELNSLPQWWEKIRTDSYAVGLRPLLIFRPNGMPIMVGTTQHREWSLITPCATFQWLELSIFPLFELLSLPPKVFLKRSI